MTYIPDCRTDEYYNEKYLSKQDKEFLRGYDWATEMAVDNFFDNNYDMRFDEDDFVEEAVLKELPEEAQDTYTMEFTFVSKEEERTIKTVIDKIRYEILEWIEMNRDELITSMIDGMDDKEYQKIKSEVDANENV